ncbi:MAG: hypothetical protein QM503_12205 [Bacteroidota bacterium]
MKKLNYKIPESCDFHEIKHAFSSNACSPKILKPEFEGIIINAPKKMELTNDMEAFIACSFSFSNKTDLGIFNKVKNEILFTIVDTESHVPKSGKAPGTQNPVPLKPSRNAPKSPAKNNGDDIPLQYLRGYVNIDIFNTINTPKKVGKYVMYATISTYKSNVLEFEIIEQEK